MLNVTAQYSLSILLVLFILTGCGENKITPEEKNPSLVKNDSVVKESDSSFIMHDYAVNADSIVVESRAKFDQIRFGEENKKHPAFVFTLKILNKGNQPIPTIQTARKNKLNIIINNNKEAMFMTLANFAFGEDQTLLKDSSDTWDFPITLDDNDLYGKQKFTFQWVYMGIESLILEADPVHHTVKEVKNHLPDNISNR